MTESIDELVAQAKEHASEKNYEECAEIFLKIFKSAPESPVALTELAAVLLDIGQAEMALSLLAGAIDEEHPDIATLKKIAAVLRGLDRTDEAADFLICALTADPSDASLADELRSLLKQLGRSAEFDEYFSDSASEKAEQTNS